MSKRITQHPQQQTTSTFLFYIQLQNALLGFKWLLNRLEATQYQTHEHRKWCREAAGSFVQLETSRKASHSHRAGFTVLLTGCSVSSSGGLSMSTKRGAERAGWWFSTWFKFASNPGDDDLRPCPQTEGRFWRQSFYLHDHMFLMEIYIIE